MTRRPGPGPARRRRERGLGRRDALGAAGVANDPAERRAASRVLRDPLASLEVPATQHGEDLLSEPGRRTGIGSASQRLASEIEQGVLDLARTERAGSLDDRALLVGRT
ncbi:hypothetical protein [Sorangium sp. So ce1151]|uniref:hypothetical protein n=1 Tax=Sorangium sp. So ce1151 TaxID=3133332 RepID=UPI003F606D6A